ncbi:MAG: pyruvate ferredoxin oxidoreductase [Firmicutes bacterium]|nr:pyruvate ferredoxin oxidoreductase [Bacillota bacterium]
MATLKELTHKPAPLTSGHRACAGCGFPQVIRMVLMASDAPVVVACATGCMEVTTTIYPYTAWNVPFIHNAFENAASTLSGVEAAYKALTRRGKIDRDIRFVAFGGDGGTYDIGLQALSGAMERGHRMLYVCYDNEGYMNTGVQRSSATPRFTETTTTPAGRVVPGKLQRRKDLTAIIAAHNIPYAAQASISNWNDLIKKAHKGLEADGAAFLNVFAPCRLGWSTNPEDTVAMAEEAVDTCFWPLYEVDHGQWRLTYKPREKKPVAPWLKKQGRFKHLFTAANEQLLGQFQEDVDRAWEELLRRCGDDKGRGPAQEKPADA